MIEVIVTNLSVQLDGRIMDHQSYIISVSSWKDLINKLRDTAWTYTNESDKYRNILPRNAEVLDLKYDDYHLSFYLNDETLRTLMYVKDRVKVN
ncbi:hypothetical protein AAXE64_07850 [Priestia megaterium]